MNKIINVAYVMNENLEKYKFSLRLKIEFEE